MKGFTWSQTTLGPRVQLGLAHLSMEHINLVQSVYTCLGQNEGLVREATFPNHKKKCVRMVLTWAHIAYYRSVLALSHVKPCLQ